MLQNYLRNELKNTENSVNHYRAKTRNTNRYEKARLRIAKFHAKLKDTLVRFYPTFRTS